MSEKKNIENLFKDALRKAGAPPPKGAGEDIKKKLIESGLLKDNNSSKRILFWMTGIIAFAIVVVTAGYFMENNNKNLTQAKIESGQNNREAAINKEKESNESIKVDSFQNEDMNENATHPDSINNGNSGSIQNFTANNRNLSQNFTKPPKREKEETSLNNKGKNLVNRNEEAKPAMDKLRENENHVENNFKPKSPESENSMAEKSKNGKDDSAAEKNEQALNMEKRDDKQPVESADSSSVPGIDNPGNGNPPGQNKEAGDSAIQNTDSIKGKEKEPQLLPDSLSREKNKKKFSIDLSVVSQVSNFKYESAIKSYETISGILNISETGKISFGGGIGINIPLNGFFIEPVINYSLMKSDFSYAKSQINIDSSGSYYNYIDTTVYVWDSILVDTVPYTYHTDSSWVSKKDTSYSKITVNETNKISIIEIPLWTGYKFSTGKFDIEIKAGASVSFITSIHTFVLPANAESVFLYTDRKNSPYRKNYFSLLAGASLLYNINHRFSVFLQPSFKQGIGSLFKGDYPVSKKIQSYSIGAGLRVKF
jgi:hypothetical protein